MKKDRNTRAKELNIFISQEIIDSNNSDEEGIRGIYCFYATNAEEEIPFYIGKSNNIYQRILGSSSSHLYSYLRGVRKTTVQQQIESYLASNYKIEIRVIRKVPYSRNNYILNANRLALAELEELVKHQEKNFCTTDDQLSESVKSNEKKSWDKWIKSVSSSKS